MVAAGIFKKYDIRGLAEGEKAQLTPDTARLIGQAFGAVMHRRSEKKAVVGRDNRLSSESLAQAFIEGLCRSGCEVIDIGLVSTPVVYWYTAQQGNCAGVMVTGSHLEPDQNGFKLSIGGESLYDTQIFELRDRIEGSDFVQGEGKITTDDGAIAAYIEDVKQRIPMNRSLKVVIDAGNGTGGLIAPELIRAWGHEVVECLYCDLDGRYPNHQPDPQKAKNVRDLGERVRQLRADVGLAFDGDADRMGAVDNQGNLIASDRVLALLSRDLLSRHPGAEVIADVSSSQTVFDEIEKAGGQAVMWMTGHSLVKAKMREDQALLAGEISGHMFFAEDYYGFDDGYFAAGRLLQILSNSDKTLAELDNTIPRLHSTAVFRPHCPPHLMPVVLQRLQEALAASGEVSNIDGIRVRFEKGWGGVRASNTEPVLSMRFEGATEADAQRYQDTVFDILREFPEIKLEE